jgi:hypothetical protein
MPADLRGLAERLLVPVYGLPGQRPQTARLVVTVPEDLPVEVAVPPGARLAGGVVRHADGRLANADLVLDTDAPAEALRFYEQFFPAQGWNPAPEPLAHRAGGLPDDEPRPHAPSVAGRLGPTWR